MRKVVDYLIGSLHCASLMLISVSCTDPADTGYVADGDQLCEEQTHPNVILILTDQQSYNAIGALASTLPDMVYSRTPNIDRLVNSGVSFTNAYCSNPVSVPSLFSLFTGMYGGQFRIRENKCDNIDEDIIRKLQSKNALGVLFAANGYDTYYGGKVHLPLASLDGTSKSKPPTAYGFGNYYTDNEREEIGRASCRERVLRLV